MEDRSHNPFVNAPLTDARSTNNNNNVDQNNENKNVNPNPFNLPPKADPKPEETIREQSASPVLSDSRQDIPKLPLSVDLESLYCPICLSIISDPVVAPSGHCYDRECIISWLGKEESCPFTKKPLKLEQIYPCWPLKQILKSLPAENAQVRKASVNKEVTNIGKIRCLDKVRREFSDVHEMPAHKLRSKFGTNFYEDKFAYLTFPSPQSFLMFCSTGVIFLQNQSNDPIMLMSLQQTQNGKNPILGTHYTLQPKEERGFDFRFDGWLIQVVQGDCEQLVVTDFRRTGGGAGNHLHMADGTD